MQIIPHYRHAVNVHPAERLISIVAGSVLATSGFRRKSTAGIGMALAGVEMLRRGLTGHCLGYELLGLRTAPLGQGANVSVPYELGVRIDQSIVINRPPKDVYLFWRDLANLSNFMENVESVEPMGGARSHWRVKAPGGRILQWDAVIHNELVNEMIAWRSLPGADVDNAGSVWFKPAADGHATEVLVEMQFNPPGGALAAAIATLWGADPETRLKNSLKKLKRQLESYSTMDVG